MLSNSSVSLEPLPGSYAVVLRTDIEMKIQIGRLGNLLLKPGFYVYTGSAKGFGGIKGRVMRHIRGSERLHWHIDYLRPHVEPIEVWHTYSPTNREHQWADILFNRFSGEVLLPRFGASDCRCAAHLFYFTQAPVFKTFRKEVHAEIALHETIHSWPILF